MGLVLDSSVLVLAERQEQPVSVLLDQLQKQHGVMEIVLSAISVVELDHGIYRAQSPQQAAKRSRYLETRVRLDPRSPPNPSRARSAILWYKSIPKLPVNSI